MEQISSDKFKDFFIWFDESNPQHISAVEQLYEQLNAEGSKAIDSDATWISTYRDDPPAPLGKKQLKVPYDNQLDNPSGEGWRECLSSSCAMVAKFWLPDLEINDYLRKRPAYGDSTDISAQIATLQYFGLKARFISWGTPEKLKAQIDRGRPTPVGWLHRGPVTSPSGGGHYSVVIGYDDDAGVWIHNDPNGEAALVSGGYVTTGSGGEGVAYSYRNWNPRWCVEGEGSGWGLDISIDILSVL